MNKGNRKNNQPNLLTIGFALLLPGMALATVLDTNRFFQIFGLILIISASAVFGAAINSRTRRKK